MPLIKIGSLEDDPGIMTSLTGFAAGAVAGGLACALVAGPLANMAFGPAIDPVLINCARIVAGSAGVIGGIFASHPVVIAISRIPDARERRMQKFLDKTRLPGWKVRVRHGYISAIRKVSDLEQERILINRERGVRTAGTQFTRYPGANDQPELPPGARFANDARILISPVIKAPIPWLMKSSSDLGARDYSELPADFQRTIDTLETMAASRPNRRLLKGWLPSRPRKPDQKIVELFGLAKPGRTSARENRP